MGYKHKAKALAMELLQSYTAIDIQHIHRDEISQ